jgi:hypothetical protein
MINQNIDINDQLSIALGNTIVDDDVMQSTINNKIKNIFGANYYRLISSCNSPIYQNERRIAFRLKLTSQYHYGGDYHFVCQCNDGSWAAKLGFGDIIHYESVDAPETNSDIWGNGLYNSSTLYFSYSYNQGGVL